MFSDSWVQAIGTVFGGSKTCFAEKEMDIMNTHRSRNDSRKIHFSVMSFLSRKFLFCHSC